MGPLRRALLKLLFEDLLLVYYRDTEHELRKAVVLLLRTDFSQPIGQNNKLPKDFDESLHREGWIVFHGSKGDMSHPTASAAGQSERCSAVCENPNIIPLKLSPSLLI